MNNPKTQTLETLSRKGSKGTADYDTVKISSLKSTENEN